MSDRPIPNPDRALAARWIITMQDDASEAVLTDHAVLLERDRIAAVVPQSSLAQTWPELPCHQLGEQALLPGLVNGHGHAAMTLMRGFADDMALESWLHERIWPLEARWVDARFVAEGSELAIAEMIAGGITTYSDMYFFPEAGAAAARRCGMRAQLLAPLIKFPTAWADSVESGLHKAIELVDEFRADPRITIGFGPHSTYTLEPKHLERIAVLAEQIDVPVQIHLHETAAEIAEGRREHGERPIDAIRRAGLFTPRLQTVHMTQLEAGDAERLAEHDVSVIHCPQSNLKLASGICPVAELRAAGVRIGIGTDGAASNNALSMFRELHVAALVGKVAAADATALPALEVLRMATLGGAEALGMGDVIGSIEPGKQADLIALDMTSPACTPVFNPVSQIVYTGTEATVTNVWVAGETLLDNGLHTRMDIGEVRERALRWRDRMLAA
ncbi:MAG: TRZ/ATZ family hydrolase [Pseudomonadota bacterium]|nr:TRZ/ATZ family hydrolase [Pseudomonadota bacterium]